MEISSLGGLQISEARCDSASLTRLAKSAPPPSPSSGEDFAALLKRAAGGGGEGRGEADSAKKSPKPVDKTDKLYEQCEALETFLIKNLLSGMRKTVLKSELLDTGMAGEMYEDMLYDEYAKTFTKTAGFGLAEMAYRELSAHADA